MRSLRRDQRGSIAWAFAMVMMTCFIVALLWMVTMPAINQVSDYVENNTDLDAGQKTTVDFFAMIWRIWPVIAIIGVILFGLMYAHYRTRGADVYYGY